MFDKKRTNQSRKKAKIKECVWCNDKNAIRSHFIQKKQLKEISCSGEVFYINPKNNIFDKIGCKKAATLTAFCSKHDKEIFQPIEDDLYNKFPIQNLLFFIRNISKEFHLIKEWNKSISNCEKLKNHSEIKRNEYSYSYLKPRFEFLKSIYSIQDNEEREKKIAHYLKTINITLPYFVGFLFSKAIIYNNYFSESSNLPLISIDITKKGDGTEIIISYSITAVFGIPLKIT